MPGHRPCLLLGERRQRLQQSFPGWELRYRDPAGGPDVVTANELHLPVGRAVHPSLSSPDVIHSLWAPQLAGKMDLVPGRQQHLVLSAGRAGTFDGACAEYCGEQHTRMALRVVASEPARFEAWLQQQRAAPRTPEATIARAGRGAFLLGLCGVPPHRRRVGRPARP